LRGIDLQRFVKKLGQVSSDTLEDITLAAAAIIELP
jgi:hypothetical protein